MSHSQQFFFDQSIFWFESMVSIIRDKWGIRSKKGKIVGKGNEVGQATGGNCEPGFKNLGQVEVKLMELPASIQW